ncbi:carbohydrate ABC transporter permease [Clostridium oryzae]|uniref:L-arabinose transport system permease protein AraQ n=1 Tax=Clostridium oryzae TaxID=1450648 RepID=A0A1V4IHM9_9CLOT|nr:carbohydrate ABC transporter permease [Clostridium oryzae]OPJ59502.1 L-arabinose transport system permease protein AraQ [Clostridium oryzae]
MKTKKSGLLLLEIVMVIVAIMFLYPIILMIFNSLKSFSEVMANVIALPKHLEIKNYTYVWKFVNYPRLFLNNLIITTIGIIGIIFFASIASYKLSRTKTKYSWLVYLFCITPMLIPFQTIMITVLKLFKVLHLTNSTWGLGIQYWGFGVPMAIFIYHGFVKTIPKEIDESAVVDGASSFRTFFSIIFPLLKPVTSTIVVIDVMWIWNDFLLPLLMVNATKATQTLTLAAYTFVGQYITNWQYAMAAMVLAVFPSILFFIFMQKHIVKGVTAGAVKG